MEVSLKVLPGPSGDMMLCKAESRLRGWVEVKGVRQTCPALFFHF